MQPLPLALCAATGLIYEDDLGLADSPLDGRFDLAQLLVAAFTGVHQRSLAELMVKQIAKEFLGSCQGQELVVQQVLGEPLDAGTVLGWLRHLAGKQSAV